METRVRRRTKRRTLNPKSETSDSEYGNLEKQCELTTRNASNKVIGRKPRKCNITSHNEKSCIDNDCKEAGKRPRFHKKKTKKKKCAQDSVTSWLMDIGDPSTINRDAEHVPFETPCGVSTYVIPLNDNISSHLMSDNETPKEIRCSSRLARKLCSSTPFMIQNSPKPHKQTPKKYTKEIYKSLDLSLNKTKRAVVANSYNESNVNTVTNRKSPGIYKSNDVMDKETQNDNGIIITRSKDMKENSPVEDLFGFEKLLTDSPFRNIPEQAGKRKSVKKIHRYKTGKSKKDNRKPSSGLLHISNSGIEKNMDEEETERESLSQLHLFEDNYVWKKGVMDVAILDVSSDDGQIQLKKKKTVKKATKKVVPVKYDLPWKEIMEHELVIESA